MIPVSDHFHFISLFIYFLAYSIKLNRWPFSYDIISEVFLLHVFSICIFFTFCYTFIIRKWLKNYFCYCFFSSIVLFWHWLFRFCRKVPFHGGCHQGKGEHLKLPFLVGCSQLCLLIQSNCRIPWSSIYLERIKSHQYIWDKKSSNILGFNAGRVIQQRKIWDYHFWIDLASVSFVQSD